MEGDSASAGPNHTREDRKKKKSERREIEKKKVRTAAPLIYTPYLFFFFWLVNVLIKGPCIINPFFFFS